MRSLRRLFAKGTSFYAKDDTDVIDEVETKDDKKTVFRPISPPIKSKTGLVPQTNGKNASNPSRGGVDASKSVEEGDDQLQLKNSRSDSPNKSSFLGRKSPARTAGSPNSSHHPDDEKPGSANSSTKKLTIVPSLSPTIPNPEIQLRSSEQDPSPHQICIPTPADVLFPARLCHLLSMYRQTDQNFDFSTLIGMTRLSMSTFVRGDDKSRSSSPSFLATAPSAMANKGGAIRPPSLLNDIMQTMPGTPIEQNRPVRNVHLTQTHKPILSSLLGCQEDVVVEGFYHEVWGGDEPSKSTTTQQNDTSPSYDSAAKQKPAIDRTEVAIFQSDYHRKFLVVYQGSAESQTKPILKKELKTPLNGRRSPQVFSKEQPVHVFPPFRKAYFPVTECDLEQNVFNKLDELAETHPFFDVVMTGHSFGATLALLASMRYACSRPTMIVSCIAFGCPKMGALNFRHYVNSLPNLKVMRFEYGSDPWINTPENPAWVHAGHAVVIDSQTTSSTTQKLEKTSSQAQQPSQAVRAYKFGDRPIPPQAAATKFMGGLLSRHTANRQERAKGTRQERQQDHDISSYIKAVEQATKRAITLWPRHFVGEDGSGVSGSYI